MNRRIRTHVETRGAAAETAAARWLQQQGLSLILRNFRHSGGEVDLIMCDGNELVFVEVRLRSSDDFGDGAESVTAAKRRRIVRAARHFLHTHPRWRDNPCRFDVLAASADAAGGIEWRWLRGAFLAD